MLFGQIGPMTENDTFFQIKTFTKMNPKPKILPCQRNGNPRSDTKQGSNNEKSNISGQYKT